MTGETLYTATDYFRPFPEAEDVFAEDVEEHARYLLPLASVNLAHLRPGWTGWIHLIAPIEPCSGIVGEYAECYETDWCKPNWLGYHMMRDKCLLAADFRLFQMARGTDNNPYQKIIDLKHHYKNAHLGYQRNKDTFSRLGHLPRLRYYPDPVVRASNNEYCELINDLGGKSLDGNWSCQSGEDTIIVLDGGVYIDDEGTDWGVAIPQTPDGRDFEFIGRANAHEYTSWANCMGAGTDTLLFYDPVDQIALTTFDWS